MINVLSEVEGVVNEPVDPEIRPTVWGLSRRVDRLETHLRVMQRTLDRISNSLLAITMLLAGGLVTAIFKMLGG